MNPEVAVHLNEVVCNLESNRRIAADPVQYGHRYRARLDIEIACVVASCLAYGRVAAFCAVLDVVFEQMDRYGGPASFVRGFTEAQATDLTPLVYRFNRGSDLALLFATLQTALVARDSLEPLFRVPPTETARESLIQGISTLRRTASELGDTETRGFRYLLPSPKSGSACKRWCLFLRWMVRPNDGVDFGLWTSLSPAQLVIPLDTHVARIARFIGLSQRKDTSWRTAVEITEALRELDPSDPVRYDFAIAHLGISGACKGYRLPEVCNTCPLEPVCIAEER